MQLISKIEVLKVGDNFTPPTITNKTFQQQGEQFKIEGQQYYLNLEIRYIKNDTRVIFSASQLNNMVNSIIKNIHDITPFYFSFGNFEITFTDMLNGNAESIFSTLYDSAEMITIINVTKYINFNGYIKSDFSGKFTLNTSDVFPEFNRLDEFIKSLISLFISQTA